MEKHLPESAKEDQELVPGGDLRILGNAWLRTAWDQSKVERVPRESEIRKVVGQLANLHEICTLHEPFLDSTFCFFVCETLNCQFTRTQLSTLARPFHQEDGA